MAAGKFINIPLILLFLFSSLNAYSKANTAIVFSGGGMQTAVFLGMLEGVEEEGVHPDVVVSTCGGSIAAAIAQILPTSEQRHAFLKSEAFHQMMLAPRVSDKLNIIKTLKLLAKLKANWHRPSYLESYIMHVDPDLAFGQVANIPFSNQGLRVAMVAARENGKKSNHKSLKNGDKPYTEVFFTDPTTARDLEGFQSPLSRFSDKISHNTDIILNTNLIQSARASITDPYFIDSIPINGEFYLTGGIDLYPLEVAHALAEEVVMQFTGGLNESFEAPVMQDVFGYNINERLKSVTEQSARYWVDFSDFGTLKSKSGFNPKFKFSLIHTMQSGVPKDLSKFQERVDAQWNWGKARGLEAIQLGRNRPNYKYHIRKMTKRNSTVALRMLYKTNH